VNDGSSGKIVRYLAGIASYRDTFFASSASTLNAGRSKSRLLKSRGKGKKKLIGMNVLDSWLMHF